MMRARTLEVIDLGRRPYEPTAALQERLAAERRAGSREDTLLFVEHDPVYTLGRGAVPEHVLAAPSELAETGATVVRSSRGGDVTYHGPGQLVGYPIIDLAARRRGVVWYVDRLEETLIRALAAFGIDAARDPVNRGVWVGRDKVAALGIRVAQGVTTHGFALNVTTDLSRYRAIVPCGLADRGVTSLALLAPGIDMPAAKRRVAKCFAEVFGYRIVEEEAAP